MTTMNQTMNHMKGCTAQRTALLAFAYLMTTMNHIEGCVVIRKKGGSQLINILLVEDQRLVCEGIFALLAMEKNMSVTKTLSTEEEFYKELRCHTYDVILMNMHIKDFNSIKAAVHVKKNYPDIKVIYLTTFTKEDLVIEAILAGADGFLQTSVDTKQFIQTIRNVHEGDTIISGEAARILAKKIVDTTCQKSEILFKKLRNRKIKLTKRELDVAFLLMDGKTNRDIAAELFLTEGTVKNYISELYTKLNLHRRQDVINFLKDMIITHAPSDSA